MTDDGWRKTEDGGQRAENLNGRHDGRSKGGWRCKGAKVQRCEGGPPTLLTSRTWEELGPLRPTPAHPGFPLRGWVVVR